MVQLLICPPSDNENSLPQTWSTISFGKFFKKQKINTEDTEKTFLSDEYRKSLIIPEFLMHSQTSAYESNRVAEVESEESSPDSPDKALSESNEELKDYTNCDTITRDFKKIYKEFGIKLEREKLERSEELTQNVLIILLTLSMKGIDQSDSEAWKVFTKIILKQP